MKIVILLLIVEIIASMLLKFFVSNICEKETKQLLKYRDLTDAYSEWQLIPEMENWISNAQSIDKMRANQNSPVRASNEDYYDDLIREIESQRSSNLSENRIIEIISNRMENA